MILTHQLQNISFDQNHLYLQIDGKPFAINLEKVSIKLKNASEEQRSFYKISPSGYGIHWPLVDEDLSVDYLLKAVEQ